LSKARKIKVKGDPFVKRYVLAIRISMAILVFLIMTGMTGAYWLRSNYKAGLPGAVNTRELFSSNSDYTSHIEDEVRFEDVKLRVIEIVRGDNFWTIARDGGVDIDTLIGANPYWDDLLARLDQVVVVPDKKGVIRFLYDLDAIPELAREYGVEPSDVHLQELPEGYRKWYKYREQARPVAVFLEGARPRPEDMTKKLAARFEVREMFRSPLGGRFSSFFGQRRHPIFRERRFHNGIDIAAPYGRMVGASRKGKVVFAGWRGGYGKAVIIQHDDGYRTLYGHLSRIYVRANRYVATGQIIGRVGSTGYSTGPHLHFTLWKNGKLINPMEVLW
jgi:murein DD-endopeptidase MepM/ murein hydrolase activator NlpD